MKVIFNYEGKDIELLDRDILFDEGEQVIITEGEAQVFKSVHKVVKVVSVTGNNAECAYKVYLG